MIASQPTISNFFSIFRNIAIKVCTKHKELNFRLPRIQILPTLLLIHISIHSSHVHQASPRPIAIAPSTTIVPTIMDYSYLNQAAAAAAAGFEASSCALAATEMQCAGYGDLGSCSQMSQAAYRYRAAAAVGYPGNASSGGGAAAASAPGLGSHHAAHPHAHAHHASHAGACSVMAARGQDVVHRHAASIFPSAINLQGLYCT